MWPFSKKQSDTQAVGGTIGGEAPRPFKLPAKVPQKHQTAADALDWLCSKHKATYERDRTKPDNVRIRVTLPSGDVVAGNGKDSLAAVVDVTKKIEAMTK